VYVEIAFSRRFLTWIHLSLNSSFLGFPKTEIFCRCDGPPRLPMLVRLFAVFVLPAFLLALLSRVCANPLGTVLCAALPTLPPVGGGVLLHSVWDL